MSMSAEQIAQVCHAANRAVQEIQQDPTISTSPIWPVLDAETKASAIDGVEAILSGRVTSPEESHANWRLFKEQHGWNYGPIKDEGAKTHPLLVPYSELPEPQRVKDALFWGIIQALR